MTEQNNKRIFLAGASGAIGRVLALMLRAHGWTVLGTTRSETKLPMLQELGIDGVVVDVFDADKLRDIVSEFKPDVVIHQLTDLPLGLAASQMEAALERNARLRIEGTRNLVAAAVAGGAKRMIVQSIAFIYDEGEQPHLRAVLSRIGKSVTRHYATKQGKRSLHAARLRAACRPPPRARSA